MATERYVKTLRWFFTSERDDPRVPGQKQRNRKTVVRNRKVSTAPSGDEPNTTYGVSEADIAEGDRRGVFYSDSEVTAMQRGLKGSTLTQHDAAVLIPQADVPVNFGTLSDEEMAKYISDNDVTVDELLEIGALSPDIARTVLNAEHIATGGELRAGLVEGLSSLVHHSNFGDDRPEEEEEDQEPVPALEQTDLPEAASALARPPVSATRSEWNYYAREMGVEDPESLASKDAVVAAVDELNTA